MKLTKYDKDAFVSSVMDDVPQIDYKAQADALCKTWAVKQMPPVVGAAYAAYPQYFDNKYINLPSGLQGVYAPVLNNEHNLKERAPDLWEKLLELAAANRLQCEMLRDLRRKVEASIYGCTTLKQAKERLPEFEKYLPADRDGKVTPNLPALANLVTDLTAAGWPKDKATNDATINAAA